MYVKDFQGFFFLSNLMLFVQGVNVMCVLHVKPGMFDLLSVGDCSFKVTGSMSWICGYLGLKE